MFAPIMVTLYSILFVPAVDSMRVA